MRICIYGAGVIGGVLAGALARAGHEVAVVARGAQLRAIKDKGLRITKPKTGEYTVRVPASEKPSDLGPQDLVIVATKQPALPGVARDIGPLLQDHTLVGFAVNGMQ